MTDLLKKINNVRIGNTDIIKQKFSENVILCCEKEQNDYKAGAKSLEESINFLEKQPYVEKYAKYLYYINKLKEGHSSNHLQFVETIVKIVEEEYNIILSEGKVKQKLLPDLDKSRSSYSSFSNTYEVKYYPEFTLSYEDILTEILEQLGGVSFEDREFEELRKKVEKLFSGYRSESKITVKKNKLTGEDILSVAEGEYSCKGKLRLSSFRSSGLETIAKALQYFEKGHQELGVCWSHKLHWLTEYQWKEDFLKKQDAPVGYEKLNSFKLYKNGKIELNFNSNKDVLDFMEMFKLETKS